MSRIPLVFSGMFILSAIGCASIPNEPSVMALPGTGLSFEQFRKDDTICRQYAFFQVGGTTANRAAMISEVPSTGAGTAQGAAGGEQGAASNSMSATQQHFDTAYIQCMYVKGHQVPVSGQFSYQAPCQTVSPTLHIPPPPPGPPPPPPPAK